MIESIHGEHKLSARHHGEFVRSADGENILQGELTDTGETLPVGVRYLKEVPFGGKTIRVLRWHGKDDGSHGSKEKIIPEFSKYPVNDLNADGLRDGIKGVNRHTARLLHFLSRFRFR